MGKLSNIFGVLALLLAGAAAFFSFTISQRRAEFRARADKMATAMVDIVKAVDADSGTTMSSTVTFTPGDAKAGTKETGSLGADKFHEAKDESGSFASFQTLLDQSVTLVKDLGKRRNDLAEAMMTNTTTLALPAEQVEVATLRNLSDAEAFGQAIEKVQAHVAAVQTRDEAMVKALVSAAEAIGDPIDVAALNTRQESRNDEDQVVLGDFPCAGPLASFGDNVTGLNTRANEYVKTLSAALNTVTAHDGIFEWSADQSRLEDKTDYEAALTQMTDDFGKLNAQLDNLVATKKEVVLQKEKIDGLETDLSQMRTELNKVETEALAMKKENRRLNKLLGIKTGGPQDPSVAIREIEGKVLRVDNDYNYVILDLGRLDEIREGTELLVARDGEFIAKIQVAKVLSDISVADILPLAMQGRVKPDDKVILPALGKQQ